MLFLQQNHVHSKYLDVISVRQRLENISGQALVEFALVFPIVILLLVGMLEFGLVFNAYLSINNASREGAREASLGGSDSEIVSSVADASPTLSLTAANVSISPSGTRVKGDSVTVTVTHEHQVIIPLIGTLVGNADGNIPLEAQTTMRVEAANE